MTRDEIIKLATQAGWQMPAEWDSSDGFSRRLERFATLVAAAERERIIAANAPEIERINAELSEWKKFPMAAMLAAEKAVDAAIALEREACAKHFKRLSGTEWLAENVADEIRARGQK